MTAETDERPVVVMTESGDVDPGAGVALLEQNGFEVVVLTGALPLSSGSARSGGGWRNAVAAIIGLAPFGAAEMDRLPALRLIATTSTGVDMVDERAAAERGIEVVGLGGVATREVATHTLALILTSLRELQAGVDVVRGGGWTSELTVTPPDVGRLVLGLVGFGRIARETARLARPLFERIVATDPFVTESENGVELMAFDTLLDVADVVSLHLPATADTRRLIGERAMARLRPGALLVNASRAEIVDSAAVLDALESGRVSRYAADVLDGEPPAADDPLRSHPRAIVTPHMGFLSTSSLQRYELDPARTIIERLAR
ncbi:C-terminal binding protein [Labedella phragmitis]|uniref:C-terminal binding protein n=1 Tax=Labedella phragmitis TaxID=2498849 RepID=A0A3S4BLS1_9MICO|nr:NAD(P)-dependent oxidoreductase [Labedella phragmitis]RWZ52896.1 C-terminal binding protein [Labedella phragmitis]